MQSIESGRRYYEKNNLLVCCICHLLSHAGFVLKRCRKGLLPWGI